MSVSINYQMNPQGGFSLNYNVPGEGNKLFFGTGIPSDSLASHGDAYIDTLGNRYYIKSEDSWGDGFDLIPKVEAPKGVLLAGLHPPTNEGQEGDLYLEVNFLTQQMSLYQKNEGNWGTAKAQFLMKSMQNGAEVHQLWIGAKENLPDDKSNTTYYDAY